MSKQQTDKSKYPSKYSPNQYVTEAQFIIELICEKKAKFDNVELPIKFWNLPQWSMFFKRNLRRVHKLLKEYNGKAMLNALNLPEFNNSYSVFTDRFIELVVKEQAKLDIKKDLPKSLIKINRKTIDGKLRLPQTSNTIIDLLDREYNEQ